MQHRIARRLVPLFQDHTKSRTRRTAGLSGLLPILEKGNAYSGALREGQRIVELVWKGDAQANRIEASQVAQAGQPIINAIERYFVIYVRCSLDVCNRRDPPGLYKKAEAGEIQEFTGVSARYQERQHSATILGT